MASEESTPEEIEVSEIIMEGIKRCNELLDEAGNQLASTNGNVDLIHAFTYWCLYPLQKKLFIDNFCRVPRDKGFLSKICLMQCKLDENHKLATQILMQRAEKLNIDSALIWKAANYCRELLDDEHCRYSLRDRGDDQFPGCFSEVLFDLPVDVRQAIQDGHAVVMRLMVKLNVKAKSPDNWTQDEEAEAKRLISAGTVKSANMLRDMLSMNRQLAQELYRHITGKEKKKHRMD